MAAAATGIGSAAAEQTLPEMPFFEGRLPPPKPTWTLHLVRAYSPEFLFLTVYGELTNDDRNAIMFFFRDHEDGGAQYSISDKLVTCLGHLQHIANGEPLTLFSGYRTPRTNKRKPGSASNSRHIYGQAADIGFPRLGERVLFSLAERVAGLDSLGIGEYRGQGFAHLDTGTPRRWVGSGFS